jgi:hypothetical protein
MLRPRAIRVFAALFLWAQVQMAANGAELCVTVMDLVRLPIHTAKVRATDLSSGKSWDASVDSQGKVCLRDLPEGLYSVQATAEGFLEVSYRLVRVVSGRRGKVPGTLSFWLPFAEVKEGRLF